ncbi:MAG: recombinase family protein [Pseudonocardiaceae bacterium]
MTERAAVYCRISEDPRGLEKGVTRQAEDCEALVRARGWRLVGTWTDNDVAVLRPGAYRLQYDAMLAAADLGEITRIVAYGLSRLWRSRTERAAAIERLSKLRVGIALVKGSDLDLSSAAGRMYAGMLGEFDTAESEVKAERVARAAQQRAEEGRANGAALYGWHRAKIRDERGDVLGWRDEIDSHEAKIVHEIVDRLIRGHTLKAITADLNARGLAAPNGGRWLASGVRKVALRPANVGERVHRGEVIGPAAWSPIVDRDRHDRVTALLGDPSRRKSRSGARKHLLSFGIGQCGKAGCGSHLRVVTKCRDRAKTIPYSCYQCDGPSSCVTRAQAAVDDLVERVVVLRLAQPDARDLLARDDGAARAARERADAIRARLDGAADDYAAGDLDRDQLRRITARLRPELDAAEQQAIRAVRGIAPELLTQLAGPQARQRWEALTVVQRRALLAALEVRVTILPARGGPGFKPESVVVEFGETGENTP